MTKFILDTRITGEPCQWLYILFWKVMILQERKFIHSVRMKEADCQIRRVILKELFGNNLGDGSMISPPLNGACVGSVKIGRNVLINSNLLAMARGGITIEDNAMIAANVQLISNNHDPYDLCTLTCKPVLIREYAWVGAGATILPGVCIGRHAIVGAGSVVTKDVPDYAVAVGNPAKVIKMLDKEKFQED